MAKCLHKRLMSERGASITFALFVLLVCMAVSSIVLAAATASSGQFAKLGEYDQRYYSVTSAAGIFRDALGSDGEAIYTYKLIREGEAIEYADSAGSIDGDGLANITWDEKWTLDSITITSGVSVPNYDYLKPLTNYALFKKQVALGDKLEDSSLGSSSCGLPYNKAGLFNINPSLTGVSGINADTFEVSVDARSSGSFSPSLNGSMVLELSFYNVNAAAERDKFKVYYSVDGHSNDIISQTPKIIGIYEISGSTGDETKQFKIEMEQERTIRVTWSNPVMIPGKGF